MNCPSDMRTSVEVGVSSVPVNWNEPFAFDGSVQASVTFRSHESGQLFSVNVTNVSYVFDDGQAFCNFSVTVDQGMYICNQRRL